MTAKNNQPKNEELAVLGTHAAGATDLFQTRHTSQKQTIKAPKHPGGSGSSGVY
ncbi:MAG TPA: hypothetical protein VE710_24265 [Candidatus Bathyarchaeia archaeon]|nr:hypothetical protein [Candidatus Bathyarchaeia archaeon]